MKIEVGVALVCVLLLAQLFPVNLPLRAEARLAEDDERRLRAWAKGGA